MLTTFPIPESFDTLDIAPRKGLGFSASIRRRRESWLAGWTAARRRARRRMHARPFDPRAAHDRELLASLHCLARSRNRR